MMKAGYYVIWFWSTAVIEDADKLIPSRLHIYRREALPVTQISSVADNYPSLIFQIRFDAILF